MNNTGGVLNFFNNKTGFNHYTPEYFSGNKKSFSMTASNNGVNSSFTTIDRRSNQQTISVNYKGNSGGVYWGSNNVSQTTENLNSNHQKQYVNSLRQNQDNNDVRLYIGDAIISNTESGGNLAIRDQTAYNKIFGIGYGGHRFGGELSVNRDSTKGDLFDSNTYTIGAGIGVNAKGIGPYFESVYGKMNGKTSNHGWGGAFGFRLNVLSGPEVVVDINRISHGVKYTIPIGSLVSNLATGNFVGFALNFQRMFVGEKLPIPQHEVIYPDDKPQETPQIQMFEVGTNQLTRTGVESLKSVVKILENNPDAKIELGTYKDDISWIKRLFSSSSEIEKMSKERAEIIKQVLISMGIPEDRISIGHSKVNPDDTKMVVEDHNTGIRYTTNGKLTLNENTHFTSTRSSPKGEALFEELKNSEAFKTLTNGKDKFEIELAANLIFDKVYLSKTAISTEQVISDIQKFYDQGKTLSQASELMDDKQAIDSLNKNKEFLEFVKNNNLNEKEAELLAGYVLEVTDFGNSAFGLEHKSDGGRVSQTLSEALNQYQDTILNKGISLSEMDIVQEKFNRLLENNPIYQHIVANPNLPKDERILLSSKLFSEYIEGQEKDMSTVINQTLEQANLTAYHKGESLSYMLYMSNPIDKGNGYYEMRKNQVDDGMKKYDGFKQLFDSDIFKSNIERLHNDSNNESIKKLTSKEKELFKTQIEDIMLKNPTISIEQAANHIVENTYQKGITLSEIQKNDVNDLIVQYGSKSNPTLENTQTDVKQDNQEIVNVANIENTQKEMAPKSNVDESIINTQSIIKEQAKVQQQQQDEITNTKNNTVSLF